MKFASIVLLSLFLLGKDKPTLKVNPDYLGIYNKADGQDKWTLKQGNKPDRVAFYHNNDTANFLFYVVMKDSTHFSTKGEFADQPDGQPTTYWSAKGEFLPEGQMKLTVKSTQTLMKLSIDLEAQEPALYVRK